MIQWLCLIAIPMSVRFVPYPMKDIFLVGGNEDLLQSNLNSDVYAYLPLQVLVISDKIYLWGNFSNEQNIQRGEEILEINGMSSSDLLKAMLELTPSDGDISSYAYRKIEDRFSTLHYFSIDQAPQYSIKVKDKTGQERHVQIQALVRSKLIENLKEYYADDIKKANEKEDAFYTLETKDGYSVLTLPSF